MARSKDDRRHRKDRPAGLHAGFSTCPLQQRPYPRGACLRCAVDPRQAHPGRQCLAAGGLGTLSLGPGAIAAASQSWQPNSFQGPGTPLRSWSPRSWNSIRARQPDPLRSRRPGHLRHRLKLPPGQRCGPPVHQDHRLGTLALARAQPHPHSHVELLGGLVDCRCPLPSAASEQKAYEYLVGLGTARLQNILSYLIIPGVTLTGLLLGPPTNSKATYRTANGQTILVKSDFGVVTLFFASTVVR